MISICRPAGSEAAAGKNPVGHVGKISSLLAFGVADALVERVEGLEEVGVWLCSQIGQPLDVPQQVFILAHLSPGLTLADVERPARAVVAEALAG